MKIPNSLDGETLLKRAHEIVSDLILEYGTPVTVEFEQICESFTCQGPSGSSYEHAYTRVGSISYVVMDHKFETIKDLKKALNNRAFL